MRKFKKHLVLQLLTLIVLQFSSILWAQSKIKLESFIQSTVIKTENNKGLVFGFDRIRFITKGTVNEYMDFKLHVDMLNAFKDNARDGGSVGFVRDAVLNFKLVPKVLLSVGKFKTPIGMEFNTSGKKLDFVKRGLQQSLIFDRDVGFMLHSKKIMDSGLGFAAGIFNAGPYQANDIGNPADGQDYSYSGRLNFDPNNNIHAEAYGGGATVSADSSDNVYIVGSGARAKFSGFTAKAEYMIRSDKNNPSVDGSDFYVQGGYMLTDRFETAVKYEKLDVDNDDKDRVDMTLGFNIFLNPKKHEQSKIHINYVHSDLKGASAFQILFQGILK